MRRAAALLLCTLPLLGGCAAAAIPVLATAIVGKKAVDGPKAPELYTVTDVQPTRPAPVSETTSVTKGAMLVPAPVTLPAAALAPLPAKEEPAPAPAPKVEAPAPAPARLVAKPKPAKALAPAPAPMALSSGGYTGLAAYVLPRASSPESNGVLGVIDPTDPLGDPRRSQCGGLPPAVMVDLDPGLEVFDPTHDAAQPGLADALSALRGAGVTVLWTSALPVEKAEAVHAALARTKLDPDRTDRLLLLNGAGDRKQARRMSAARNWCVIAIAGDRRGDFDEAFDYLKNPEAVIPADKLFGDGWFLAPAPIP